MRVIHLLFAVFLLALAVVGGSPRYVGTRYFTISASNDTWYSLWTNRGAPLYVPNFCVYGTNGGVVHLGVGKTRITSDCYVTWGQGDMGGAGTHTAVCVGTMPGSFSTVVESGDVIWLRVLNLNTESVFKVWVDFTVWD